MLLDLPALAASLGAPDHPGWLGDALVALHPGSSTLAVAYRHRLALLSVPAQAPPRLLTALDAVAPPESVTSLRWVVFAASGGGGGRAATRPPRSPAVAAAAPTAAATTLNSRTAPRMEDGCLLVGTSTGHVQVHAERSASSGRASTSTSTSTSSSSARGRLLHRQRFHAGPVVSLRLRPAGAGLDALALDDDISITSPDAVARLAAAEVRAVGRVGGGGGGGPTDWRARLGSLPPLGVQKWELGARGTGPRSDGIVLGPRLPRLRDALDGRDGGGGGGGPGSTSGRLVILSAGSSPALAAHDAEEHAPRGTAALVADLAASVAAGLLGAARAAVSGRDGGLRAGIRDWVVGKATGGESPSRPASAPDAGAWDSRPASATSSRPSSGATSPAATPGRPSSALAGAAATAPGPTEKAEPPPPGEPALLWRAFADPPRRITTLLPAPTGALAAAADALGRILLVDGADGGRILRVWKGYRGAQLAWVQLSPASAGVASAASPTTAAALAAAAMREGEAADAVTLLVLVVYAPRRGVVEGWCPVSGARLGVARVGAGPAGGVLVAPDAALGLGGARGVPGGVGPRDAWVVDGGSGEVTSVVRLMEGGWVV